MFHLVLLLGLFSLGACLPRQYHFINENKTWAEAQRYCRENYDDLATINNAEEELDITNIKDIWDSSRTWIGLYDDLNSWKWSLNNDSFYKKGERNFRNWHILKPVWYGNWYGNSLCVYISSYNGVWWEGSCSWLLAFICFDGRVNASERYVVVNQFMSWTEAQRYCRENYTDLASVRNETENQMIRTLISALYYNSFWIGLHRSKYWSDGSISSFSNWKSGQPDNHGLNESCTAVSFNNNNYYYYYYNYYYYYDGTWTDESCGKAFPFICYNTIYMNSTSFRQYHFVNVNKTWTEAQRYCREKYADLATINNTEEMNTLFNTVNYNYPGLAWIGLYGDLDSWTWSLDDDAFYQVGERDYRGWDHQPDNYNGRELCVYMSSGGTWFDGDCNSYFSFVCYDERKSPDNYIWVNQPMSWTQSQSYCREHYTDLASVRNQTDNQRIFNITGGSYAWIGLYRNRLWSDKQESTYENWRPATQFIPEQPDNGLYVGWENGNQHCTAVSFRDSGHWTDENCFTTFPFICYDKSCTGSSCPLHQYHFVNENKTWTEAQRYCREKYTDLATINNMKEMNTLRSTVDGIYSGLAWIGLYDDLNSWKWSLDGVSLYNVKKRSFTNWYINKPSWGGYWYGDSLCAYMSSYDGVWSWSSCSSSILFICFNGRVNASERYVLVYQSMSWTEAQRYCREHYTDLTSVRNETENQMIRTLSSKYYYYFYYWIGLYRTRSWSDDSNSTFRNWKPGQPDHYGQNASCTTVSLNDLGKWTDENCNDVFPFICYSTMSPTSSRQYHFVNENKTWTEAQRYCRKNYTDLATIDNTEEMNTLLNTVNGSYTGLAWIGLYGDLDSWRWSLDDDAFYQEGERDYRGWRHEPDNYNGKELCASMNNRGEWFDRPCTDRKTFICCNGANTYLEINSSKTWEEAQSFCRMYYTDLASVRNETELQQILSIMTNIDAWIGLYRNRLWSDASNSTFTYWNPSIPAQVQEPDNGAYGNQMGNQHCTAVDYFGQWIDESCSDTFPFICYTASTPGAVMGLRLKVRANENLLYSEVEGLVLMQLEQELSKIGLSKNVTMKVRNIQKLSP